MPRQALLQQGRELLLAEPLAPAAQRGAVERQIVPEHRLAAEELEIRVLHPARAQRFVGQVVHVLEDQQPRDQPGRQRRLPGPGPVHRTKTRCHELPIDLPGQPHQRVPEVDDRLQRRPEQLDLTIVARSAHRSLPSANAAQGNHVSPKMRIPKRKKAAAEPRLSCKIEYLSARAYAGLYGASTFLTDD